MHIELKACEEDAPPDSPRSEEPDQVARPLELLAALAPLSLFSWKLAYHHELMFSRCFCEKRGWMSKSQFYEIADMVNCLPGETPAQTLVALVTISSRSVALSLASLLLFMLPTVLAFLGLCQLAARPAQLLELGLWAAGVAEQDRPQSRELFLVIFKLSLLGAQVGAATVLFTHFLREFQTHCGKSALFCLLLVGLSCCLLLYNESESSLKVGLVVVLLLTMYVKIWELKPLSLLHKSVILDLKRQNYLYGYPSIYLLLLFTAALWLSNSLLEHALLAVAWDYFFLGVLVFGSGHSLVGLLFLYAVGLNGLDRQLFWFAVPCSVLVPGLAGPGLVAFTGHFRTPGWGALVALGCFYLPNAMMVYGFLPKWGLVRSTVAVQRISVGLTCFNLGLCLYGLGSLLANTGHGEPVLTALIFIIAFVMHYMYEVSNPGTLLLCVALANIRRWGMIYYRQAPFELNF